MNLLLDTCSFLWIISGDPSLSHTAQAAFADPENEAFLSTASVWEILVKHQLGRLPLPHPPGPFVTEQRKRHAIASLAIDEESALQLPKLPNHHRDPFDRMLVCQAIAHGLVLLTPDETIQQYPVRTFW